MKNSRLIVIALIAIMSVFATASIAFAGEVTYQGKADGFVFSPGSTNSPTDLFTDMDKVMPGDMLTDTVDVANKSGDTVKIYMRALGATDEDKAFLSQMDMGVTVRDGNKLFGASPDQKAGLEEWNLIGTMSPGAKATLDITIDVPITMGNEYQSKAGTVNWQFKAEVPDSNGGGNNGGDKETDDPGDGDGGKKTNTGDKVMLGLFFALLAAAAIGITTVAVRRRMG